MQIKVVIGYSLMLQYHAHNCMTEVYKYQIKCKEQQQWQAFISQNIKYFLHLSLSF